MRHTPTSGDIAVSSMTPGADARQKIDADLVACGWRLWDYKRVDLSACRGIALREVQLKTGPCSDYLLIIDRKPVGVIQAQKKGTTLSGVATQSADYASVLPDFLAAPWQGHDVSASAKNGPPGLQVFGEALICTARTQLEWLLTEQRDSDPPAHNYGL
ncbi:MAG TPA: hypothetical protein VHO24_19960 [Opitutaceae bacterium]|nr:hypothetical protein [Opitutaceae bacterium]